MKTPAIHKPVTLMALLTLALGGCGSAPPAIPPTPLEEIVSPKVLVLEQWKRSVGEGNRYAGASFEPVIADGIVYVASAEGRVSALALEGGDPVWREELEQELRSGVSVDPQSVYVASREGQIIALDRENGNERWRTSVNREILEPPVVAGGRVLARAANGDTLALDVVSGEQLWRYGAQVPDLAVRGSAAPAWVPGGYLVPLDDGRLVALDERNGRPVWEAVISEPRGGTPVERIVDVDTQPVVIDDAVVVGSRRGDLVAVDGKSGRVGWRRQLSSISSLATAREQVYVVESNGEISAVDVSNGSAQWRQEGLRGRRLSKPVVMGQYLVVGDLKGYLHWLELHSGEMVARARLSKASIYATPKISEGSLVVLDKKGHLARYTAAPK
ncbi:MAG: outer membrane protein assembly factor BamB [Granulosicoccaceae bacterium]